MSEESPKVLLNDVEYDVADLSEEQRVMVAHISNLDAKLADARFNVDQLTVARQAFVDMLSKSVEQVSDADYADVPDPAE
jgi:hypothetical protein